jgi:hypothetical protein
MDWVDVATRFGLPTMFLLGLSFALWKTGVWLAVNVVTPIVTAHKAYLERTALNSEKLAEVLRETNERTAKVLKEANEKIAVALKEANEHTAEVMLEASKLNLSAMEKLAATMPSLCRMPLKKN